MSLDESLISYVVRYDALTELQGAGVGPDHFVDEFRNVWRYLLRTKRDHDALPSEDTLVTRFPDLSLPRVRKREIPILLADLHKRKRYIDLLTALNDVATEATSFDQVDDVIQGLQGRLNAMSFTGDQRSHLVDLFSNETNMLVLSDQKKRRSGQIAGIPTGLKRFDRMAGGLQKQRMVIIMGRPGLGKSWLDLLLVKSAILAGKNVILYPLEMPLYETAYRIYTLFSAEILGADKVIKNFDLTSGHVPPRVLARFMNMMQDRFQGSLLVADVSSLADPYTIERIEAEVELNKPDMFWVDYLTLLKPPKNTNGDMDGWSAVRELSRGIKNTAMRRNCVGGASAQVNREALKVQAFLPRIEHVAYGDSIGQDTDQAISLNRKGDFLYYALVKNRGGPEFGKTKVQFAVNEGQIFEVQDDEGDDE